MTIRMKLLGLIVILVIAFAVSATIYFEARSPIWKIQAEEQKLGDLRTALLHEEIEANRLVWSPFQAQLDSFNASVDSTTVAFHAVQGLTVLSRLSPTIRESLGSIQKLQELTASNTASFLTSAADIGQDAVRGKVAASNFDLFHLAYDPNIRGTQLSYQVMSDAGNLLTELYTLSSRLDISVQVIDTQNATIAKEIARVEARSAGVGLAIVIVLIGLTIVVALVLANRIVRSVRSIEANVAGMSDGDLTRSFQVESTDEIGRLSANLNRFIATLADSVGSVQAASAENIRMKESLIVTTEQTSASTTEIGANAHSIDRQISALDENLASTGSAVGSIAGSIKGLDEQIQEQMAMVEESTASVTEMIASIDSVTKIAERRRQASEQLVHTVTVGGEKMAATFEVVSAINESVDSIKEITGIIEALSTQTNLLAMNAAIEAAHAGDAGRGFSVVADEIRKLAEASAENSQEISKILKSIVERISEASASGEEMNSAFAEIDREVRELSQSLGEIYGNMSELRTGGDQILSAMSALSEVSVNVKGGSGSINENTRSIGAAMATVQRISAEVRSGMGEIARGIKEISDAVANVLSIAERLGAQGESLNTEITRFKTA